MSDDIERIMRLFAGSEEAYGTYRPGESSPLGGKVEIKSSARTIRAPVTLDIWRAHIEGKQPLGMIPLGPEDMVKWGCIDVDKYDIDHTKIVNNITRLRLPLILTKSKSGGAHIFLFLKDWASPIHVRDYLRQQSAALGLGGSEIFPKQMKILREHGDVGNWIVMPYFGQTQEAVNANGGILTLSEFLSHAETALTDPAALTVRPTPAAQKHNSSLPFGDGPPCLQHLTQEGFPEGTRNSGLFALGVYCKRKFGEEWPDHLEEFNRKYMHPPLTAEEVNSVVRSLQRREYFYRCNDPPIVNHCNAPLCRVRPFGVGGGQSGAVPNITGLSVLETDPPVWFMDVDDRRLELTTDQLISYKEFQKVCVERMLIVWQPIKQNTWTEMIAKAMETATRIEAPIDTRGEGKFREILEEFLTNRQKGQRREDLFSGRPWEDDENGKYWFRMQDLEKQLARNRLDMTRGQVMARIRDLQGGKQFMQIKGRGVNTWWVPKVVVEPTPVVDPPELPREVM